ncbi:hypothetical protein SAMN05216318_1356 [Nitrosomonas eutropha]|nr:hypothetical protein SAMN05216318_1356 [Nitrosomonas eutropha]
MYYEETWINGALHTRGTPNGMWRLVTDPVAIAAAAMRRLTDAQRHDIMGDYCSGCGTAHKPCYCLRDD